MTTGLSATRACITKHFPASLIYPVLDKPTSQEALLTSGLVLWNSSYLPAISTLAPGIVENSRIRG